MRNTWSSSNTACTAWSSLSAESRSVPNGFSMITRVRSVARPAAPSMPTTEVNATGGTARWYSRRGEPPISFSALLTAATSGAGSSGSAEANDSRSANEGQDGSVGLVMQKSAHASSACSLNCSSVSAYWAGEDPMMRYSCGSRPAACRWNSPGSSLRLARSPVAPNSTMTWFSGREDPFFAIGSSGLLLRVTAELRAHRREDLPGERAVVPGLEPFVERGGDDRGGHGLVHRGQHRPPALARVRYPAAEVVQVGRLGERGRGQVDQPGADHRAAAPHLGDIADVDVVLVGPRVAQRRGLRVDLVLVQAHVGLLDDRQALGDRGHHAVLDAVVHHLDEVPGAVRPAVQVTLLGGAARSQPGGRLRGALARGDGQEDRVQPPHRLVLAADHQAVATVQSPDAAAGTAVDVVEAVALEVLGPGDVIPVVGVPAVDHDVVGLEQRPQLVQGLLDDAGRDHDPQGPRLVQPADEVGQALRALRAVGFQRLDRVGVDVVDHAVVAVAHEPADEVGAHPAEPDHPELHRRISWHGWFVLTCCQRALSARYLRMSVFVEESSSR